jgi:hypothetical protein
LCKHLLGPQSHQHIWAGRELDKDTVAWDYTAVAAPTRQAEEAAALPRHSQTAPVPVIMRGPGPRSATAVYSQATVSLPSSCKAPDHFQDASMLGAAQDPYVIPRRWDGDSTTPCIAHVGPGQVLETPCFSLSRPISPGVSWDEPRPFELDILLGE